MIYEYYVPTNEKYGSHVKTFAAKVTGLDPVYRYTRTFIRRRICTYQEGFWNDCILEPYSLYDVCIRYYDDDDETVIHTMRNWVITYDNDDYREYDFNLFNEKWIMTILKDLATLKQQSAA